MTGMETKRARGKCIANALVCQLCWTFLFVKAQPWRWFWSLQDKRERVKERGMVSSFDPPSGLLKIEPWCQRHFKITVICCQPLWFLQWTNSWSSGQVLFDHSAAHPEQQYYPTCFRQHYSYGTMGLKILRYFIDMTQHIMATACTVITHVSYS